MKRRLAVLLVALACTLAPLAAFGASQGSDLPGATGAGATLVPQAAKTTLAVTYPYADADDDGANDYILEVYETSTYFKFSYLNPTQTTGPESGSVTSAFSVNANTACAYRVSNPNLVDAVTYGDCIDTSTSPIAATVTLDDLHVGDSARDATTVVDDFSLNKYDTGDLFLNVGPTGHVKLDVDGQFSLYPMRNWLPVNGDSDSLHVIEPDFHVEVVDLEGEGPVVAQEVTANSSGKHKWLLKGIKEGAALVKVTYDALGYKSAMGGPDFSAIWPENTGLIVVTVGKSSDVQARFELNATRNTAYEQANANAAGAYYGTAAKNAGTALDAELDVLYYAGEAGATYEFSVEPGAEVSVARGSVSGGALMLDAFTQDGVSNAADGTVTVSGLKTGKHVIKVEKAGSVAYQVVRAKAVNYAVYADADVADAGKLVCDSANGTVFAYTDGATPITRAAYEALDADAQAQYAPLLGPGSTATVAFDTLFPPANKLSGCYNMSVGIALTGEDGEAYDQAVSAVGGAAQRTFASTPKCQQVKVVLPSTQAEGTYTLDGALFEIGFGYGGYGSHRLVTYENGRGGVSELGNAATYAAYFGRLPQITIDVAGSGGDDPTPDQKTPQQEADEVAQLIAAIGTVNLDAAERIWKARSAYDALSDGARALVSPSDVSKLEAAESALAALQATRFKPVSIASGKVRVIVENRTWSVADGAPWDGVLLDEQVALDAESDSIRTLVDKALVQKGLSAAGGTAYYVRSIEGIGEADHGDSSGWTMTLNNWFINEGADSFKARDGDVRSGDEICVMFTSDGGPDVGSSPTVTSKALASLATDVGTLSPVFSAATKAYTLSVPGDTKSVHVRAMARNRNYQVRAYLGSADVDAAGYRPNDAIPVKNGSKIVVVSGDESWPSMNYSELEAAVYTITVKMPESASSGDSDSGSSGGTGSGSGSSAKPASSSGAAAKGSTTKTAVSKAAANKKAAAAATRAIANLPAAANVTDANAKAVKAARAKYNKLTPAQKKLVSAKSLKKLKAAEAAVASTITLNTAKVTKASIAKALKKAGKKAKAIKKVVLGAKVKKVSKASFANLKKAKTLVVKTKKLKKTTVKGALSKSKVTTAKVQVGKAKANKTYAKKYKKIFTKKIAGKKVSVKAA